MPEENTAGQDTGQDTGQGENQGNNVEELISKAITEVSEKFKTEISGLNRRNSELEKELKKKELEGLTESERVKAELEEARKEKQRLEEETKNLTRGRLVDSEILNAGLPIEFAKRIKGEDHESIKADILELKTFLDSEVNKRIEVEINKRLSGKAPAAGSSNSAVSDRQKLINEYNEAEKAGDGAKMLILKDKIRKLPKD